jgi:ABC-2 type transport system permease protein
MMLVLIAYVFTVSVYTAATAMPETLHKRPSPSSTRTLRAVPAHRLGLLPAAVHHPDLIEMRQWTPAWMPGATPSR